MALITLLLGAVLSVAALNSQTRGVRMWLVLWAVLNLGVGTDMLVTDFDLRWSLAPYGEAEPGYRVR